MMHVLQAFKPLVATSMIHQQKFKHDNNPFTKITHNNEILTINVDMLTLNFTYRVKTNFQYNLKISNNQLAQVVVRLALGNA